MESRLARQIASPHMAPVAREPFPSAHGAIHEGLTINDYGPLRQPHERRSFLPHELKTPWHEAWHVALARDLEINIPVYGVSVKRQGNSLGRTIFPGHIDTINPERFKVVVAGGTCNTPFGLAEGFGSETDGDSDIAQIHGLWMKHGGMTVSEAIARAQKKAALMDHNYIHTLAVIIADTEEAYGESLINQMIDIARREAERGIKPFDENAQRNEDAPRDESTLEGKLQLPPGEYTFLEHMEDGQNVIVYVTIDEKNNEHLLCAFCRGRDGHLQTCPLRRKEKSDNDPIARMQTIYSSSRATAASPSGRLIYTRN